MVRLALKLGRTPRELKESIGEDDYQLLRAFEYEYGIPDEFLSTAQICATVKRSMVGGRVQLSEFVPYFKAKPVEQDPAEARAILHAQLSAIEARKMSRV